MSETPIGYAAGDSTPNEDGTHTVTVVVPDFTPLYKAAGEALRNATHRMETKLRDSAQKSSRDYTLNDIVDAKRELEGEILRLLEEFSAEFGVGVDCVDFSSGPDVRTESGEIVRRMYTVSVDVRI